MKHLAASDAPQNTLDTPALDSAKHSVPARAADHHAQPNIASTRSLEQVALLATPERSSVQADNREIEFNHAYAEYVQPEYPQLKAGQPGLMNPDYNIQQSHSASANRTAYPGHMQLGNMEFARLYASVQRSLYAYVFSLIPNVADADDVIQETAAALWAKSVDYDPSQPFLNWALTFARFQALKFRKTRSRQYGRMIDLSDEAFTALAASNFDWLGEQERFSALEQCLEFLTEDDRKLLQQRYGKPHSVKKYSGDDHRLLSRMYKRLQWIRKNLLECVQSRLNSDGQPG
jgi:RNA polymerase sigma-70 factor (ECF subfamily)